MTTRNYVTDTGQGYDEMHELDAEPAGATTSWGAEATAAGNGRTVDELPVFRTHVHTETDTGIHRSWDDCAMTMCTFAGCWEWAQDEAVARVAELEHGG